MTAPFLLHVNPRYAPAPGSDGNGDAVILPERRAAARTAITGFEGYRPTPLHRLTGLAQELGIGELWLKDESGRFGLGSFKALGGPYALVHLLRERLEDEMSIADIAAGRAAARVDDMTACCASDGNHGLAVAWGARRAGARCTVFLPGAVSAGRERAIAAQGADIVRVDGSYGEAVRACAEEAHARGWLLVSDTSHAGGEEVPSRVMHGLRYAGRRDPGGAGRAGTDARLRPGRRRRACGCGDRRLPPGPRPRQPEGRGCRTDQGRLPLSERDRRQAEPPPPATSTR